ncbi:protein DETOXIFICATION 14-like isoform X2 [Momordica charantia]|nr:protein DETOXIFICATION 14-like isoform X2 [Momordica charantia]XP_022152287.1 protein DETOXIFICATION 14-like isoform X2 [Momordica charantia]XP_022152289.1 protein DETOXIFICATION 14-like isoform X2 [Momordica charantia]
MSSALETLCGQAYGAQQYQNLGIHTYSATLSLTLVCIPISFMWLYMGKFLILIGQDPSISHEAGRFSTWLIPALFAYVILQILVRFLQAQSLILPLLVSSIASLVFFIPSCWVLVFKFGLGHVGAALAIGMSYWLNVILLGLYVMFSSACVRIRIPNSMELFRGTREFFCLAIPSAVMICLEWWSYEFLTLLSGFLPNPKLETSVLSVCLSILTTIFTVAEGLGAAASTRVSNELGAGNTEAARICVCTVMFITVVETVTVSTIIYGNREVVGYVFSNEKEVVDYVAAMAPILSLAVILNSLEGVLSGVARGCGWQELGAYVNLGSYYLFGIPTAAVLGFWLELRGEGLWIGIQAGAFLQSLLLCIITTLTDWEKQADNARKRIFHGTSSLDWD